MNSTPSYKVVYSLSPFHHHQNQKQNGDQNQKQNGEFNL